MKSADNKPIMWKSLLDRINSQSVHRDQPELARIHEEPPTSFKTRFPSVPAPDNPISPTLLAAQWTCGIQLAEDMPVLAADLIEAGLDSPALRRLAGETSLQSRRDAEDLVGRAFRELGVKYPFPLNEARQTVIRQVSREVIGGLRNPWAASFALEKLTDWDWKSEVSGLYTLYFLNEELVLHCGSRTVSELTSDLLDCFAELGSITDCEKRI